MFEVEAGADEKQQIKFVWPYDIKFRTAFFAQFCSKTNCDHGRVFFQVNRSKLRLVLRQHGREVDSEKRST